MEKITKLNMWIDSWWTFVLPLISITSLSVNIFNVIVLNGLKRTSSTYHLLFIKTAVNIAYLFICFWIFLDKCGHYCGDYQQLQKQQQQEQKSIQKSTSPSTGHFIIKLYRFYGYGFLANLLAQGDLLIEILVSIERLKLLVKEKTRPALPLTRLFSKCNAMFHLSTNRLLVMIALATVVIYLPRLVLTRIVSEWNGFNSSDFSHLNWTIVGEGENYTIMITNMSLYTRFNDMTTLYVRGVLMLVLLVLINTANHYHLNNRIREVVACDTVLAEHRHRLSNTHAAHNNRVQLLYRLGDGGAYAFRRMLFYQSLVYLTGNAFFFISPIVYSFLDGGRASPYFPLILLGNNTCLLISLGLNTFVYLYFDARFRAQALDYIMPIDFDTEEMEHL